MSDTQKTAILVVGATGKQGGACIDALLESSDLPSGTTIRFLTRNTTSAAAVKLIKRGANAYKGDLLDSESLDKALHGVRSAFLVTDPLGGVEKEEQQGKTFIDAAAKAGVEHIVFTSVCAADTATQVPHFLSKYHIEQYLEKSSIPTWTVLRPVAFLDNFPVAPGFLRALVFGAFFAFTGGNTCAFISCEDIGIFGAKAILDPENPEFKKTKIDLSIGEKSLGDIQEGYAKGQGYKPWSAWFPSWIVYLLPYDFKQMFLYMRNSGYPKVDQAKLKRIHPGLMDVSDWVTKNSKTKSE